MLMKNISSLAVTDDNPFQAEIFHLRRTAIALETQKPLANIRQLSSVGASFVPTVLRTHGKPGRYCRLRSTCQLLHTKNSRVNVTP
jgi:hypothetical protein